MSTVRVIQTAFVGGPEGTQLLPGGAEFDSEHPMVKAHPTLFTPPVPDPPKKAPGRRTRSGARGA